MSLLLQEVLAIAPCNCKIVAIAIAWCAQVKIPKGPKIVRDGETIFVCVLLGGHWRQRGKSTKKRCFFFFMGKRKHNKSLKVQPLLSRTFVIAQAPRLKRFSRSLSPRSNKRCFLNGVFSEWCVSEGGQDLQRQKAPKCLKTQVFSGMRCPSDRGVPLTQAEVRNLKNTV